MFPVQFQVAGVLPGQLGPVLPDDLAAATTRHHSLAATILSLEAWGGHT